MRILGVCVAFVVPACMDSETELSTTSVALLAPSPADAVAVPADYDGDGLTDFALKGSNGVWYIDVAACSGGRCLGPDGYAGRWDFAYEGYGDANAIPLPADYGRSDGTVDFEHKADLAIKDANGMWAIDYADNGFGTWDVMLQAYGDATVVPVPADYDGDGRADIAIKTTDGRWYIDIAADGWGGWDPRTPYLGYGNATVVPVPADYDGDGCADLAIKDPATNASGAVGTWYIDYARTSGACGLNGFGGWDSPWYSGYGNATAIPVPADYDGDTKADLAIKDSAGTVYIDYANDGFGGWGAAFGAYGGATTKLIPGHYDPSRPISDKRLDLAYKDSNGYWRVNLVANGLGPNAWDTIPGTVGNLMHDPSRTIVNLNQPYIEWTKVYLPIDAAPSVPRGAASPNELTPPAPFVNGHYQMRIGVRYTVAVRLHAAAVYHEASVEVNPDLHVPPSLVVANRQGSTFEWITSGHTRVFAVTCIQPGSFPLGFMLRDGNQAAGNLPFNPDYGIRVACTAEKTGLYGTVTRRYRDSLARYVSSSTGLNGVTLTVSGPVNTTIAVQSDGSWALPTLTGGPYKLTFTASGSTPLDAVNVTVPAGSGTKVDVALETAFTNLAPGTTYKQYLDYSRGRTLLHVVRVDTTQASVKLRETDMIPSPGDPNIYWYELLVKNAQTRNAPVLMNGGYFDGGNANTTEDDTPDGRDDQAVGYFYGTRRDGSNGYIRSVRLAATGSFPLLGITGTGVNQSVKIVMAEADFTSPYSATWRQLGSPIYDIAKPMNLSDFDFAMQMDPWLVMNGAVTSKTDFTWARTTVGKNGGTLFWLVIADGEGVNGGHGAQFDQLGYFYRDVLGATEAMALDGGLSTELVLRQNGGGWRNVNTITGEDSAWDIDPTREGETLETRTGAGGQIGWIGGMFNYVSVGI